MFSEKQCFTWQNANARYNLLVGAVRSGKSFLGYYLIPKRIADLPNGNMMLIGKTTRTLTLNVIDPMREIFGTDNVSSIRADGTCTIFGRKFYCVGACDDRAVSRIWGSTLVYAHCDEFSLFPQNFVQALKSRLSMPGATLDGTLNPDSPFHWAKQDFIDRKDLDVKAFHFTLYDNPYLPPEYVADLEKQYTGVWYKRMIMGEFCMAQGLVYSQFEQSRHVIDSLPCDITQYFIGCDYATNNPTAFVLCGIGSDGCLYILNEYYWDSQKEQRQKTDADYSADLAQFVEGIDYEWIFIDPSAASFRLQVFNDGIRNIAPADNSVIDGIRRVSSLFAQDRIKILSHCTNVLKELNSYVWDEKAALLGNDKPIKQHDHALDAIRYVVNKTRNYLELG